jgi:hypothetical protein
MMADHEIDHRYTHEIVCPHCGHKHRDSWEYGEGEHDCALCERPFDLTRDVSVTYSTEKIEALEARDCATAED